MILIAFCARVVDWRALQVAWRDCLEQYRPRMARRMALYRDGHDASRALILIEYPSEAAHDGAGGWQAMFAHCLDLDGAEERIWECMEQSEPNKSSSA